MEGVSMFDETITIDARNHIDFMEYLFRTLEERFDTYGFNIKFERLIEQLPDDELPLTYMEFHTHFGITIEKKVSRRLSDYYVDEIERLEKAAIDLLHGGMPASVWSGISKELERLHIEASKAAAGNF